MKQQPEAIAAAVTAERLALCELLETLAPGDWSTPSLCPGWTVHDVVAHLTLAPETRRGRSSRDPRSRHAMYR